MNAELSAPFRDLLRFARRRHPEGGAARSGNRAFDGTTWGPFIVQETRPRPSLHTGRLCTRRAALAVVHVAPSAFRLITNPRPPARCALARRIVSFRRAGSFGHEASDAPDAHAGSVHRGTSIARAELGALARREDDDEPRTRDLPDRRSGGRGGIGAARAPPPARRAPADRGVDRVRDAGPVPYPGQRGMVAG